MPSLSYFGSRIAAIVLVAVAFGPVCLPQKKHPSMELGDVLKKKTFARRLSSSFSVSARGQTLITLTFACLWILKDSTTSMIHRIRS